MSNEVDILTPADRAPGNVVRVPSRRFPPYSGLLMWSRAEGQPVWAPISAPTPSPVVRGYVTTEYFVGEYVR